MPVAVRPPSPAPREHLPAREAGGPASRRGKKTRGRPRRARHRDPAVRQPRARAARGRRRVGIPGSGTGSGGGSRPEASAAAGTKPEKRKGPRAEGRLMRLRCGRRLPGSGWRGSLSPQPPPSPRGPLREGRSSPRQEHSPSRLAVPEAHCLPRAGSRCYLRAAPWPPRTGCAPARAAVEPGRCRCACRVRPAPPRPQPRPAARPPGGQRVGAGRRRAEAAGVA